MSLVVISSGLQLAEVLGRAERGDTVLAVPAPPSEDGADPSSDSLDILCLGGGLFHVVCPAPLTRHTGVWPYDLLMVTLWPVAESALRPVR